MAKVLTIGVTILFTATLAWADGSLYDFSTKASWDDLWEIGAEGAWGHPNTRDEVNLNYHRFVVLQRDKNVASNLISALGWDSTSRVLVVQCGFGWVLEGMADEGVTDTKCTTTSPYILNNKGTNEDADINAAIASVGLSTSFGDGLTLFTTFRGDGGPRSKRTASILNEALDTSESRQRMRTALGGPGFDVLTYDGYLQTFTDAEAEALSDNLHRIPGVGRVIHHVFGGAWAPGIQTKTLEEWKALLPNDVFVEAGTYRVL